jgi:hypothetical protein
MFATPRYLFRAFFTCSKASYGTLNGTFKAFVCSRPGPVGLRVIRERRAPLNALASEPPVRDYNHITPATYRIQGWPAVFSKLVSLNQLSL